MDTSQVLERKIRPSGSHFGSQNEDLSKDSRIEDVILSRLGGILFFGSFWRLQQIFFLNHRNPYGP